MKVIMRKLKGGVNIRTEEVCGECDAYPKVGKSFSMTSVPLVPGYDVRVIETSDVQGLSNMNGIIVMETLNSMYELVITE